MQDPYKNQIAAWPAVAPTLAAVEVLDRLMRLVPETSSCGHLRPVQRSVKACRTVQARSLIPDGAWVMLPTGSAPASAEADPANRHEASFKLPGNIAS